MFYKAQIVVVFILLLNTKGSQLVAQVGELVAPIDPVSYTIQAPESVKSGDVFTITTVFNVETGWYVYAPIAMNTAEGKIPTKVSFKIPDGIKKIGGLELPDKNEFFNTYRGSNIRMSQKFQVDKSVTPGKLMITARIVYQTCNDDICYPPVREKTDVAVRIIQ